MKREAWSELAHSPTHPPETPRKRKRHATMAVRPDDHVVVSFIFCADTVTFIQHIFFTCHLVLEQPDPDLNYLAFPNASVSSELHFAAKAVTELSQNEFNTSELSSDRPVAELSAIAA